MSAPVHEGLFTDAGLSGGACRACSRRHFPLGDRCPWCGKPDVGPVTLSRDATLWAWTAVTAPPPGYEGEVPYGFGVVELPADGLRVVTRLTEADPAALHEGQPMRFTVVPLGGAAGDTTTYAFAPA
jgi:uncharacterized OB-fold protein